jgi:hypothetical protein
MQAAHARERLFSNEFSGGEKRDRGLLSVQRNDGKFGAARLKIVDGISQTPCEKKVCLGFNRTILRPSPAFARKAAASKAKPLGA